MTLVKTFLVCAVFVTVMAAAFLAGEELRCQRLTDPQQLAYFGCER